MWVLSARPIFVLAPKVGALGGAVRAKIVVQIKPKFHVFRACIFIFSTRKNHRQGIPRHVRVCRVKASFFFIDSVVIKKPWIWLYDIFRSTVHKVQVIFPTLPQRKWLNLCYSMLFLFL